MKTNKPFVSVIMPALNEANNIELAIRNCQKALGDYRIDGEIIVVNDGSTDETPDIVKRIVANKPVSLIEHDSPQGIGASFWDGVDHAKGDIVVMLPGDNENDPWEIFRYYSLLQQVDMVVPFVFNKEVRTLFRNVLSLVYRLIINVTFLVNFNYTNGTIIYRKSILEELPYRSSGFFFQTDILIRATKKGYLFCEVPYRLDVREDGISKAVSFPSLMQVIKGYFRLVKDIYGSKDTKITKYTVDSLTFRRHTNKERAEDEFEYDKAKNHS